MRIIEAQDYKDMSRKAANVISAQMILNPESVIGLATGSTPIGVYDQLTEWYKKGDLDFSKIHTVMNIRGLMQKISRVIITL